MIVQTFVNSFVLVEAGSGENRRALSFSNQRDDHAIPTNPHRGFVLATLVSSFLWAALILAARGIWLLVRFL